MRELFSIGHFSIKIFGVMIAVGMLAGMFIMLKEADRKKLNKDKMLDLTIYTIIVSIIGARLYYVLVFNLKYYLKNPLEIVFINLGGLSIQGGLIGGILFAVWYTKKNDISFWKAADSFAPGIALGQAIGRIGCDVFGVPMENIYPWGIKIGAQILHPVQIYEMFLDLILFAFLWGRRGKAKYHGQLFMNYIIGFSLNRAIVEFFRSNPVVIGPFTVAHVTSLVIIVLALIVNRIIKNKSEINQMFETNEAVKVPAYQYVLIILLGAAGTWIYYFIN